MVTDTKLQQEWKYISWKTDDCPFSEEDLLAYPIINDIRNWVGAQENLFDKAGAKHDPTTASVVKLKEKHFGGYLQKLGNYYQEQGLLNTYTNQMPTVLGESAFRDYRQALQDAVGKS